MTTVAKVNEIFTERPAEIEQGEFITEDPKKVPVLAKCQVLVVGGGPSGLSAAISSARAGADTMLCERFGCFGGVITTVGMETIAWYRYEGYVCLWCYAPGSSRQIQSDPE